MLPSQTGSGCPTAGTGTGKLGGAAGSEPLDMVEVSVASQKNLHCEVQKKSGCGVDIANGLHGVPV